MSSLGGRAGRLASEFLIIVIGVLVALGVDAWNTDRVEGERAEMYLARVQDDLEAQRRLLEDAITEADSTLAVTDSVVDFVDGGPRPGGSSVDIVLSLFGNRRYELPRTDWTYQEMVGNAELSLIRDPEARRAVVEYHTSAERLTVRIDETRALLRNPAYQAWGAMGMISRIGDSALVDSLLTVPASRPLVLQLRTYQGHRRTLWEEWLEAVIAAERVLDSR